MATAVALPVEERIYQVLQHLGIPKAHFAARGALDWSGLATAHPEVITSLTLLCPLGFDPEVLASVSSRLLVFNGELGAFAEMVQSNLAGLPDVTTITLTGYSSPNTYADIAVDRKDAVTSGILEFLEQMDQSLDHATDISDDPSARVTHGREGDFADINYRVSGSGPPLVLLPLGAAPSQWDPLVSRLSQAHTVIRLGGAELGMLSILEARGQTPGYLGALRSLMQETQLRPGETILEVGCGTGVLARWLARRTRGRNRIVGMDVSPFFLREAAILAKNDGLEEIIEFQQGNAESLPFPDGSFHVSISSTVIQRVDATKMLSEMLRVTKPGGRVAILGHAHDMPRWVNLPLGQALKAKVEAPPLSAARGHELGCDDATLYRRFHSAGLSQIKMFPYMATFTGGTPLQVLETGILPTLTHEERETWHAAVEQGQADGTFFISTPFHCAVGTKS